MTSSESHESRPPLKGENLQDNSDKMESSLSTKRPENSGIFNATTATMVTNSVSIDVIVPDSSTKDVQSLNDNNKTSDKSENIFARYFRRKTKGMTRRQIAILSIFPFVEFFAATVISIQGPFFPKIARSKGATKFESGLVFGIFELFVCIMAPIFGAKMGMLNPNRVFNYGIFATSLSCIVFGFVHYLDDRTLFVLASLFIRSIEGIGDAAFVVASFSIIAAEFPESIATTFAMCETFYGLGLIAGPTVGGGLYHIGGFSLPFVTMGVLLFIFAIATYIFITKEFAPNTEKIVSSSSFAMFKMLKTPVIALTAYGTFAAATGIGFLNNSLEHHLAQLGVDTWGVGWIFMLNGGVYALTAPFWGKLCDKTSQPKIYSMIGSLLTMFGFTLAGPLPFFPDWKPTVFLVCIGLVIFGLGLGSTLVSAFILFLQDAISNGYPDDVTTYGCVSGLWVFLTAIGFFVGPTLGGLLDQSVGFRWGTLFIIVEQIILVGLLTWYFYHNRNAPPTPPSSLDQTEDNFNDIVITYAIKMDTPKPRKNKVKAVKTNSAIDSSSDPTPATTANSKSIQENGNVTITNITKQAELDMKNGVENPTFNEEQT